MREKSQAFLVAFSRCKRHAERMRTSLGGSSGLHVLTPKWSTGSPRLLQRARLTNAIFDGLVHDGGDRAVVPIVTSTVVLGSSSTSTLRPMSSTLYQVKVLAISNDGAELEFRVVHDGFYVHTHVSFVARVLNDSLDEQRIAWLWSPLECNYNGDNCYSFASKWLEEHADEVVDGESIELFDERNHPYELPSIWQLLAPLEARFASQWERNAGAAITAIKAEMELTGQTLQFDADLDLYRAGTLREVLEEVASAQLEILAKIESRASLRFRVRDPKWIMHLAVGDTFDSVAYTD